MANNIRKTIGIILIIVGAVILLSSFGILNLKFFAAGIDDTNFYTGRSWENKNVILLADDVQTKLTQRIIISTGDILTIKDAIGENLTLKNIHTSQSTIFDPADYHLVRLFVDRYLESKYKASSGQPDYGTKIIDAELTSKDRETLKSLGYFIDNAAGWWLSNFGGIGFEKAYNKINLSANSYCIVRGISNNKAFGIEGNVSYDELKFYCTISTEPIQVNNLNTTFYFFQSKVIPTQPVITQPITPAQPTQIICISGQEKCEGQTSFACENNGWISKGKVIGKCGYSGSAITPEPISSLPAKTTQNFTNITQTPKQPLNFVFVISSIIMIGVGIFIVVRK